MKNINIDTGNATYRQLMGNGLRYQVPPFQRDYSWEEDEWDDLWQDLWPLVAEQSDAGHYLGYLVLKSDDRKLFDIIDGQQRLTTINVMILAGLATLRDLDALGQAGGSADDNARRMEQLRGSYIGYLDPVSLQTQSKLRLNRHNDSFYQNYLVPLKQLPQRGLNESERRLRRMFLWMKDKMCARIGGAADAGRELARFVDAAVDNLFFTVINVTDELNAYRVFETLNARGVKLSATDLLKNYLMSLIVSDKSHKSELSQAENTWGRIVGALGGEKFPEYLRAFWNSRNKLVRKNQLFKQIRATIASRDAAYDLLHQLEADADAYAALKDPSDGRWNPRERRALELLQLFGVRQPLPMLLACYRAFFEPQRQDFTAIAEAVVKVSFRNSVIGSRTNEQEFVYNKIAIRVSSGDCPDRGAALAALREGYPGDKEFVGAFAEKELNTISSSRTRKIARYILLEIERRLHGQAFERENDDYSVEHILPEQASETWDEAIADSKQERLAHRLGNMTLLSASDNREAGNQGYAEKRPIYASSVFGMTRTISERYDEWNEEKIAARQKAMADAACGIWRLPE